MKKMDVKWSNQEDCRLRITAKSPVFVYCVMREAGNCMKFARLQLTRTRGMITELQDPSLLSTISGVDLIVAEAKYHLTCITDLRNPYRGHLRRAGGADREEDRLKESPAFVELIKYMENSVKNGTLVLFSGGAAFTLRKPTWGSWCPEASSYNTAWIFFTGILPGSPRTNLKQESRDSFQESNPKHAEGSSRSAAILYRWCKDFSPTLSNNSKGHASLKDTEWRQYREQFTGLPSMPISVLRYFFNSKARSRGESKTGQTRHVMAREPPLPLYRLQYPCHDEKQSIDIQTLTNYYL